MAERTEPTLYNRREVNPRRADVPAAGGPANLADILERVLDKGIVIAGDIQINPLDIELLTIKLRLLVASVERAQEMGINWWESDPTLSSHARSLERENGPPRPRATGDRGRGRTRAWASGSSGSRRSRASPPLDRGRRSPSKRS